MNILILASEYPYEKDTNADRTKVVGYFAREWVRQGHNVIAIVDSSAFPNTYYAIGDRVKGFVTKTFDVSRTPDRLWINRFSYDDFGVYVENIPMLKWIPHGKFSTRVLNRQIKTITEILREVDFCPDVITGHWVNPQIMLIPELAKIYNARSAFVFHADYTKETCEKFNVQYYLDQIDHVGFRSKSAAEMVKAYLNLRKEPFIAASGIPDAFIEKFSDIEPKTFENPELRIITAGRLVEYKKIDVSIQAAVKAFQNIPFDFTIAGDGPLRNKLAEYIHSVRMEKHIHLVGQIPRDDLQRKMGSSDIFVLISKHETFGLVYIEAMLQGCIVIASKFGGVDGIVVDGENGFLCKEGNEENLIEIFKQIQAMSVERKRKMSEKAILTAKNYTESLVSKRYLDAISK